MTNPTRPDVEINIVNIMYGQGHRRWINHFSTHMRKRTHISYIAFHAVPVSKKYLLNDDSSSIQSICTTPTTQISLQ